MKMNSLFFHVRRPWMLMSSRSSVLGNTFTHRYSTKNKEEALHEIGEKARSTAEEFCRQAKEKSESMKQSAKEVWVDAKEEVSGETQEDKDKFKEKVEKGNYDKMGRD